MKKIGFKQRVRTWITSVAAGVLLFGVLAGGTVHAVTQEEHQALNKGIDVSEFNGVVNYEPVKKAGITYVMIRTGAGKSYSDQWFENNYDQAGQWALKRGVYHYSYATTVEDAKQEAKACLKLLAGRKLELPVAYDIEEDKIFETGIENVTAIAQAFCEEIKNAGYEPMVYTYLNRLNDSFDYDTISQYKLWVASYDVDYPNYAHPYYMWQYKVSSVPGANTSKGECDVNYIYEQFTEASAITLDQTELSLQLGEGLVSAMQLTATVNPEASNRHVNWRSEDEKVATVDQNGQVTAVTNGATTIVAATVNGVEAQATVTVTTPATAIEVGNKSLTIGKKENFHIIPVLTPETSTDQTHYESADESIVKVEKDGSLTGKKIGKTEITCTTDSGVSKTVTVTVKKAPWYLSGLPLFKSMKVSETYQMHLKMPKNSASNQMDYYSRNVYRVSISEDGLVTALKPGWCILRVKTYNGKREWMLVHVKE